MDLFDKLSELLYWYGDENGPVGNGESNHLAAEAEG